MLIETQTMKGPAPEATEMIKTLPRPGLEPDASSVKAPGWILPRFWGLSEIGVRSNGPWIQGSVALEEPGIVMTHRRRPEAPVNPGW